MSEQTAGGPDGVAVMARTRHREQRFPGRQRAVQVRLSEEAFAAIGTAAGRAWLTPTPAALPQGYVGAVTLAAASGTATPAPARSQQALAELMAARVQVHRFGGNVNQAAALTARAVRRVDAAVEQLMRRRV